MSDPALAVQKALVGALKADPTLAALVAGRIYDQPPAAAQMPYVSTGEDQVVPDRADGGYEGSDITVTIHAWSRATGFPEVKQIAAAIRIVLAAGLSLDRGTSLVDLTFADARAQPSEMSNFVGSWRRSGSQVA